MMGVGIGVFMILAFFWVVGGGLDFTSGHEKTSSITKPSLRQTIDPDDIMDIDILGAQGISIETRNVLK